VGDTVVDDLVLPRRTPGGAPAVDSPPSPEPRPAPPVEAQPVTARSEPPAGRTMTARRSVFEQANPAPALPDRRAAVRPVERPEVAPPQLPTSGLPTLPVSNPTAPPAVAAPVEAGPTTSDMNAYRSAQLRASRQQHQGKLFGRSLLAFVLIGGLIAAALVFGRSYVFTTEWDAALTPIVDDIQQSRGGEFDHTVPLVVQPAGEYASTLLDVTVGNDWSNRVPEWRALGLASGSSLPEEVASALASVRSAVYDPRADVVYQSAAADPATASDALRAALVEVYERQQAGATPERASGTPVVGVTGVSSPQRLVELAVDHQLLGIDAASSSIVRLPADAQVPIPIRYELAAIESLGAAVLSSSGVEPTATGFGEDYPEAIYGVLDDRPIATASGILREDDVPLGEPVAWGVDDWTLVWGARLPAATVDRLTGAVIADSYRTVERGGATCFVSLFQTASESDTSVVLAALLRWTSEAPAASQAAAAAIEVTLVQLEACDPGTDALSVPDPVTVDALLARQLARLTS
jgi:hypothetical protein